MSKNLYIVISIGILALIFFAVNLISDILFTLLFLPSGILMLYFGIKEFREVLNSNKV